MAKFYEIYPIFTSKLINDQGWFTYRINYGNKLTFPIYAWLIKGGEKPLLVDTGCVYADMKARSTVYHIGGEPGPAIEDSLQALGVSTSEIETVILTHLHFDHILNAKKFPNATFVVQEAELKFADNPHPLFAKGQFDPSFHDGLKFKIIKGDLEIMPGIELISTPGHTPGGQSVSVKTAEHGKAVIVGYCSLDENFSEKGDLVAGLHSSLFEAYDSMVKIRKIADTIIPSHSQRLLNVKCIS